MIQIVHAFLRIKMTHMSEISGNTTANWFIKENVRELKNMFINRRLVLIERRFVLRDGNADTQIH